MERLDRRRFLQVVRWSPLVSIDLVVRDPRGRILLGFRKNAPARSCWFVPGGRVCKDESLADAFRRITRDELGVERRRQDATFLGVHEHFYADNVGDEPGFGTHYVVLVHELVVDDVPPHRGDAQHRELRWFTARDAIADPDVHPNTKVYLADPRDPPERARG